MTNTSRLSVTRLALALFTAFCLISNSSAATLNLSATKFISYTDIGSGTPLVLIHAFPTDKRLWESQQNDLQKYFRVITLDLPGFGLSSPVEGSAITMSEYANEVKAVLDHLKIQQAIIGGESMGGYIALAYLQQFPDHVTGLILSDTQSIADNAETKIKREAAAVDALQHGTAQLITGFLPKALTAQASQQTRQQLQTILTAQPATAVAAALRGMAQRDDTSTVLATTKLPILILTGEQDTLISPQQSQNMHMLAKHSKLVTITNAAHLASLEQPEQWNQAVIAMFYQRQDR